MEFYKIKFKADAYNEVIGKLVLRSTAEMGFLDGYNKDLGAPLIARFILNISPTRAILLWLIFRKPLYWLRRKGFRLKLLD
jgi:outer membrane protein assembly factor BamA